MDHLDFDGAEVAMNPSSLWQNPQESFYSIQFLNKNSNKSPQMFHAPAIDLINPNIQPDNWNFSLNPEIPSSSSPPLPPPPAPPLMAVDNRHDGVGISSESLDCLLSGSNTNKTADQDDHEISMMVSNYKSLWNIKDSKNCSAEFQPIICPTQGFQLHSPPGESGAKNCSEEFQPIIFPTQGFQLRTPGEISEFQHIISPGLNVRRNSSSGESACDSSTALDHHETGSSYHTNPNNKRLRATDFQNPRATTTATAFQLFSEPKPTKRAPGKSPSSNSLSNTINFQQPSSAALSPGEPDSEAIAQMKEMIYRAAAFRPVNFGSELMEKPKRKNVRISSDPQTVAARQRRERISDRIRVLQKLVPGGSKMDTASMLDEAANYLKFLRSQVIALEAYGQKNNTSGCDEMVSFGQSSPVTFSHTFDPLGTDQFGQFQTSNCMYNQQPKI